MIEKCSLCDNTGYIKTYHSNGNINTIIKCNKCHDKNEDDLQNRVGKNILSRGWDYKHIPRKSAKKRNQLSGILDFMVFKPGLIFLIEFKPPSNKYYNERESQISFIDMLKRFGLIYITSRDYDEIIDFLDELELMSFGVIRVMKSEKIIKFIEEL